MKECLSLYWHTNEGERRTEKLSLFPLEYIVCCECESVVFSVYVTDYGTVCFQCSKCRTIYYTSFKT
jgi:hypothetical protein